MFIKQYKISIRIVPVAFILFLFTPATAPAFPYKDYDISVSGTLSQVYDSNVDFSKDDKTDNYSSEATITLGLKQEAKRRSLSFAGSINRSIVSDVPRGNESLNVRFNHELSEEMTIKLSDDYYHSKQPYSFTEEFYRRTGRFNIHTNVFGLNLDRNINKDLFVSVDYTNSLTTGDKKDFSDSKNNIISTSLNYIYSPDKIVYLSYFIGKSDTEDSPDLTSQGIRAGLSKFITKRITLSGYFGFGFNRYDNGREFNSNFVNVLLNSEINMVTNAGLSFYRGRSSFTENDDSGTSEENWRVSAIVRRNISEKLNGSVEGFYGEHNNNDNLIGASSTIQYTFNERLDGNLGFNYSDSRSLEESREYSRYVISLGLTYVF